VDVFETIRVALEALSANKLRSGLTMLGIVIGVGAVIALMSIGSGAQQAIAANIKSLGANLITITPGSSNQGGVALGNGSAQSLTIDDANAIADPENAPAVAAVSPELSFTQFKVPILYKSTQVAASFVGVTPAYEDVHSFHAALGAWFTQDDMDSRQKVVMLGANVANELFGSQDPTGQDVRIRAGRPAQFRVVGVLQSKGGGPLGNIDDQILLPLTTLQRSFSNPRNPRGIANVTSIVVSGIDAKSTQAAKDQITGLLLQRHRVQDPDFVIQTQDDQIATQTGVTQVLTILLGAIAGISLVVGGIGIMNIMIVSVTERTREIGIRKAVGARRADILTQFLVESLVVSLLGGALGIFIGIGASRLIDGQKLNGQVVQTLVSTSSILLAVGVSLVIGLVFGVYPAYRAASLHPIDALRYE
jgi:putative ABC transport system permease protein